jgi:thiosulfate dehydrogenase [quinone] large subunit
MGQHHTHGRVYRYATIAICLIAGAWTVWHIIWVLQGQTADDAWGRALLVLFVLALVRAFQRFLEERSDLVVQLPLTRVPSRRLHDSSWGSAGATTVWFVLRMYVGATWFIDGWQKVHDPAWGTSGKALAGFIGGALSKSPAANPALQGWYGTFLRDVVLPHASFFSVLVSWGERAVGLGLLLGALTSIAAGFGVLMNLNYLLAGTIGINPILGALGLFLCLSWRVCGWIGLDSWLLPALGLPWQRGEWFQTAWRGTQ